MPWHRKPWSTTQTPNTGGDGNQNVAKGLEKFGDLNTPVRDAVGSPIENEDGTIQQQTFRRPDPKATTTSASTILANQSSKNPPGNNTPPAQQRT